MNSGDSSAAQRVASKRFCPECPISCLPTEVLKRCLDLAVRADSHRNRNATRNKLRAVCKSWNAQVWSLAQNQFVSSLDHLSVVVRKAPHITTLTIRGVWESAALSKALACLPALKSLLFVNGSLSEVPRLDMLTELRRLRLHSLAVGSCASLAHLTNLEELVYSQIRRPEGADGLAFLSSLVSLQTLTLSNCNEGNAVPSLEQLTALEYLSVESCGGLKQFQALGPALKVLRVSKCPIEELPDMSELGLAGLHCHYCEELTALPALSPTLIELVLDHCRRLNFDVALSSLRSLEQVNINRVQRMPPIVQLPGTLKKLWLINCGSDEPFSVAVAAAASLEEMDVHAASVQSFKSFHKLVQLRLLSLYGCIHLSSLQGLQHLPKLRALNLGKCQALENISWLENNTALEDLTLHDLGNVADFDHLSTLISLRKLDLERLTSLSSIPRLSDLEKLRELSLSNLPHLDQLPSLPSSLEEVTLHEVPVGLDRLRHLPKLRQINLSRMLAIEGIRGLKDFPALEDIMFTDGLG